MNKIELIKKVVFCFLLLIGLQIQAEDITSVQNRFYGGDSLMIRQMESREFDIQGKDHTWSLKNVTQYKKKLKSTYFEKKDTVIGVEFLNHVCYLQSNEGLSIVSIKDRLIQIDYDEAELYLRFPMKQGDSIIGQFSGKGLYCEQIPMQRYGTYVTKADSIGKIVLPNSKEIRGVMRVHTQRQIHHDYGEKLVERTKMQEDLYRWFAEGYRYPILEARVTTRGDEVVEQLLFYCDPEEQELLASNDVNKLLRDGVVKSGEEQSANKSRENENEFKYDITQSGQGVTIHYETKGPTKIMVVLASNQGYVYQQVEKMEDSNNGTIDINTNGLRRGHYVIYLNVNGKSYSEKMSIH